MWTPSKIIRTINMAPTEQTGITDIPDRENLYWQKSRFSVLEHCYCPRRHFICMGKKSWLPDSGSSRRGRRSPRSLMPGP